MTHFSFYQLNCVLDPIGNSDISFVLNSLHIGVPYRNYSGESNCQSFHVFRVLRVSSHHSNRMFMCICIRHQVKEKKERNSAISISNVVSLDLTDERLT